MGGLSVLVKTKAVPRRLRGEERVGRREDEYDCQEHPSACLIQPLPNQVTP